MSNVAFGLVVRLQGEEEEGACVPDVVAVVFLQCWKVVDIHKKTKKGG